MIAHQLTSFNHFMRVEVPQTIQRSCPVKVTGSPDLPLNNTTRAVAGTAGTNLRVTIETADDAPAIVSSTKPGGPLLQAATADPLKPPPREVEVCVEFANVQIRKPTEFKNDGGVTPMYPNICRLRNMTYAAPVYLDMIATYTMTTRFRDGRPPLVEVKRRTLPHVHVGKIPVMVHSDFCVLSDTPEKTPKELGECPEDDGGYFITQGGERVIISQERMSENMPFVFRNKKVRNKEVEVIDIKSIGPDNEGAPKSMSVKIVQHGKNALFPEHIIVTCPRIKAEIPLFILMRALGVQSDKEIIELVCGPYSKESIGSYAMIFQECIEAASSVLTTEKAHEWLAANLGSGGGSRESYSANTLQSGRGPKVTTVKDILAEEVLPHIGGGTTHFEKAAYIAYVTKKVLDVFSGKRPHDDRDGYPNKKVELPGNLMGNLFRYLFSTKVIKDMKTSLTKEIHNGFWKSSGKMEDIINPSNVYKILKSTYVSIGLKTALATGNFNGGKMGIRKGLSQVLNRLNYGSSSSHARRVSTSMEKTVKLLEPRKLNASQIGFICPSETPEGHAVGVVKNMSSTAMVSLPMSPEPIVGFLYDILSMKNLGDVPRAALFTMIRIFVNGAWIGVLDVNAPGAVAAVEKLRAAKRSGRIHNQTGITYRPAYREVWINTEGGRLLRPLLNAAAMREVAPGSFPDLRACNSWNDILQWKSPAGHSLIEYVDPTETENFYIAMTPEAFAKDSTYSHMEIHPSTLLGTMASNIPFPDHNQAPRNSYQAAMGKQAMGIYALNFRERMDTMSNLLWYSTVPLASPFMSQFYKAQTMPSGFNIVVAIMTYGGYNQEDSVMINRAALDRGLFRSEFYRTYKDEEKKNQASGEEERFCVPNPATTKQMKDASYLKLGDDGLVPENVYVTQDDVLIGKVAPIRLRGADGAAMAGINHESLKAMSSVAAAQAVDAAGGRRYRDVSKLMRTNEAGYVDRIYRGRNGEGYSFVKIRVREERVPVIGDKFSSRHGQKGTCGLILEPWDMPQTRDGIIPDIIINPHAIPSRMTIAQLMETLVGRLGCELGFLGDASPFNTNMTAHRLSEILQNKCGLEPHSNEILYCGYTGKQMPTSIFMGPCFYQRLKHMVNDKIHCLTPDHDVLTDGGWKPIDTVTKADKVAIGSDRQNGSPLTYANALEFLKFEYDGPMYEIKTASGAMQVVTSKHRCIIHMGLALSNSKSNRTIQGPHPGAIMTAEQIYDAFPDTIIYQELLSDEAPYSWSKRDMIVSCRRLPSNTSGFVYCLRVPTEMFVVRHKSSSQGLWTGNSRATGPLVMLTRQPAEGRARDGGLRFGEMERDVMIAHGASAFLKERMMEASDNFEIHVCKGCGLIAVANKERNIWMCTGCNNTTNFSQVRVPYAYKLFLQELESMNISSRLLPETRLRALADAAAR